MIGPYYRPQLTSMLSILHRITGVVLTVLGLPMMLWWLIALGHGPGTFAAMQSCLGGFFGKGAFLAILFCLSYHFLNGIRHMVWDTGRGLEMRSVYMGGILVATAAIVLTAILAVVTLWA
jgi:succinate dehydrogenase / fumarate reductase cytochrome b subunit